MESSSQTLLNTDNLPISMKLQLAIDETISKLQYRAQLKKSTSFLLKYELSIAEHTGKRLYLLDNIFKILLAIPPTSLEAERLLHQLPTYVIDLDLG